MSISHSTHERIPPSTLRLRLREAREWRELEQKDLAEALDVGRTTISNYERGISKPSKLQVNAWAVTCDVDVEWLKTGHAPQNDGPNSSVTTLYRSANVTSPHTPTLVAA